MNAALTSSVVLSSGEEGGGGDGEGRKDSNSNSPASLRHHVSLRPLAGCVCKSIGLGGGICTCSSVIVKFKDLSTNVHAHKGKKRVATNRTVLHS